MALAVHLLGSVQITRDDQPISVRGYKAVALLAYLLLTGKAHTRQHLIDLLFDGPADPKASLRWILSELRQAIGAEFILADRRQIAFNFDRDYWFDVDAFKAGQVELYRGDFLEGLTIRDALGFEDWASFERERLRGRYQTALEQRLAGAESKGAGSVAIETAHQLLRLDNLREDWHRALMRAYAQQGKWGAALAQYQTCRQVLADELGVEPDAETTALNEQIRAGGFERGLLISDQVSAQAQITSLNIPPFLNSPEEPVGDEMITDGTRFVAREQELTQLTRYLEQAQSGQGGVVFVTGDPGSGKTTLIREFIRRATMAQPELIVAVGNCNAFTGIGDPYSPFREILGLLTGDVEAAWASGGLSRIQARRLWALIPLVVPALLDTSPDLLDIFIPSAALVQRTESAISGAAAWLSQLKQLVARHQARSGPAHDQQTNLFEQYSKVLQKLARQQPLLLVLDDLQWADLGSANLLFHLGRQLTGQRILIVGLYRPADVALGRDGERHPMEPVVNEFQRNFGQIQINLNQTEGRSFVKALLDSEPCRLGATFREALYQHARGQALFTVETLREMKERGDLVQDELGLWMEGAAIDWTQLPSRIEGVIGERIGRLPAALQEIIKVASVIGEEFVAEVVARVLKLDKRELIRQLSGVLDKQHHLVQSQGSQHLAGQRLSQYRFRHILFQYYLYHDLDEVERAYLHEEVGHELEQLYQSQPEVGAIQLARHFQEAGLVTKALDYLEQAGEQAIWRFAYQEAIRFFKEAMILLKPLPETSERQQQELRLHLALAEAQWKAGQIAEAMDTFQQSADMAAGLRLTDDLARAALGFEYVRYRFNLPAAPAVRLLEEALIALGEEDSVLRVRVLGNLTRALLSTETPERLEAMSEEAIEIARRVGDPVALYDTLQISVLAHRWPEKMGARITAVDEMLRLAQEMDDRDKAGQIYPTRVNEYLEFGDIQMVEETLNTGAALFERLQQPFHTHVIQVQQAMHAMFVGNFAEGERLAQQALATGQQMQVENVDGVFGIQMFTIQREIGGLRKLVPVVKSFVERNPEANTWRPGLALIYSDLGFGEEARTQFELLAVNDFAAIPQDALWVGSIAYLSEVCAFLGDVVQADILYQFLLPYARLNIVVGYATVCFGAASRYLGLLATTLSRWETAEQHYEAALEMNARMGAKPWLAHTQYQYAAMLLNRDRAGDRDQALPLLDEALVTAHELGMTSLLERATTLHQEAIHQLNL